MKNQGKAWVVSLIGIFGGIALACVQNKISPCIPVLMEYFSIDMTTAGWLSSIFAVMGMVAAVPSAIILKKLGAKKAGIFSLLFAAVGSIIGLFSDNVTLLMASRVIEGFGVGVIAVVGPTLISMWFPPEKRGFPMGLWGSWMTTTQAILFFTSGPITARWGWHGMWGFGLIMCLVAAALFIWKVETPPAEENFAPVAGDVNIGEALKSFSSWTLCLAAFLFCFATFGFVTWIGTYWSSATGWDLATTNKWIALLYFLEIFYSWGVGALLNTKINRKLLGCVSFIIYGCLLYLVFTVTAPTMIIALVIIYPVFDAMTAIVLWTVAAQTAKKPEYIGVAIGILNIGLNLGTIVGGPAAGFVYQKWGATGCGMLLAAASFLGCVVLVFVRLYGAKQDAPEAQGTEANAVAS